MTRVRACFLLAYFTSVKTTLRQLFGLGGPGGRCDRFNTIRGLADLGFGGDVSKGKGAWSIFHQLKEKKKTFRESVRAWRVMPAVRVP